MLKVSNFLREVTARLTGDEKGVIAAKNERKANSAIKGQLAALEAKQVDAEAAVEDAQEALKSAKYPTYLISDNTGYVNSILQAQKSLDSKNEALADIKKTIEYWGTIDTEFKTQVDEA